MLLFFFSPAALKHLSIASPKSLSLFGITASNTLYGGIFAPAVLHISFNHQGKIAVSGEILPLLCLPCQLHCSSSVHLHRLPNPSASHANFSVLKLNSRTHLFHLSSKVLLIGSNSLDSPFVPFSCVYLRGVSYAQNISPPSHYQILI